MQSKLKLARAGLADGFEYPCSVELVGVTHSSGELRLPKRELLFFDKVAVVDLSLLTNWFKEHYAVMGHMLDEYEWLVEHELVFEPQIDLASVLHSAEGRETWLRFLKESSEFAKVQQTLPAKGQYNSEQLKHLSRVLPHLLNGLSYEARLYAAGLRLQSVEAVSALELSGQRRQPPSGSTTSRTMMVYLPPSERLAELDLTFPPNEAKPAQRSDILSVVIEELPVPDDGTPWEDILNFRRDPDSSRKLLAIREWTRSVAAEQRDVPALREKLAYLLEEYRAHMKLHRLKYSRGVLETIVVTTAEVTEDILKFKWKALAEALFSVRKSKIALLEAEAAAPGREVSYIVHAQAKFGAG